MTVAVDYAAIWDYNAQPKETVAACNLCGSVAGVGLTNHMRNMQNRYGFQTVSLAHCSECSLWFLNPRMTREAYARFYETGAYRALVSAFHGREINAETLRQEQVPYAEHLARILEPWAPRYGSLLDIGGSTGIVAAVVMVRVGLSFTTVLEPSSLELRKAMDAERIHGTIEDFDAKGRTWDLITLCQTADHLLDLMGSLRKIKSLLSPDGLFWSDIVDFDVTREVKIDHPFNLTERTYRMFLEKAGFKLLQINYAPDGKHVGFLAR